MKNYRCLVFDDHPLVGVAVREIVKSLDFIESVDVVINLRNALDKIKSRKYELLILDVNLSDQDGYTFLRLIKSHGYEGKVIFYSAESSSLFSELAYKSGANGYVCKSEPQEILRDAIEGVCNGYTFFKLDSSNAIETKRVELSNREAVVMLHLLQGKSNKQIADILLISDKTVSTYKQRIFDKYGVENVLELARVSLL